jgi:hypothetical protein
MNRKIRKGEGDEQEYILELQIPEPRRRYTGTLYIRVK